MRESSVVRALSLQLVMASAWLQAQGPAPTERVGAHFRVVLHEGNLPVELATTLADDAVGAVEATWPVLERLLPLKARKGGTLNLYADEKAFRSVEKRHAQPFLVEGFCVSPEEAHVLLWPELPFDVQAFVGLSAPTATELQRCAIEQVVRPLVAGKDEHGWLRDVVVAGLLDAVRNPKREPGVDLGYDVLRGWLTRPRKDGTTLLLQSLCNLRLPATDRRGQDTNRSYYAVLAQHLASVDRTSWAKKLLGKHKEPQVDHAAHRHYVTAGHRRQAALEAVLGADWPVTELKFERMLAGIVVPLEAHLPLVQRFGSRILMASVGETMSLAEARVQFPKGPYVLTLRGEWIETSAEEEVAIEMGYDGRTTLAISHWRHAVTIAIFDHEKKKWVELARREDPLPGLSYALVVEVDATELRVRTQAGPPLVWKHAGRELRTLCAVRVTGLNWFDGLTVAPLQPSKK